MRRQLSIRWKLLLAHWAWSCGLCIRPAKLGVTSCTLSCRLYVHTLRVQDIPYVPTFAPPHYSACLVHVTPREIQAIAACQTQLQPAFVNTGVSRGRPSHSLHHDQLRQLSSHAEFALKMVPPPITGSSLASWYGGKLKGILILT